MNLPTKKSTVESTASPALTLLVMVGMSLVLLTVAATWFEYLDYFTKSRTYTIMQLGGAVMMAFGLVALHFGKQYTFITNIAIALASSFVIWFILLQKIPLSDLRFWSTVIAFVAAALIVSILHNIWEEPLKPVPLNNRLLFWLFIASSLIGLAYYVVTYIVPIGVWIRLCLSVAWFCLIPGAWLAICYGFLSRTKIFSSYMIAIWLTASFTVPAILLLLINIAGISLNYNVVRLLPLALNGVLICLAWYCARRVYVST